MKIKRKNALKFFLWCFSLFVLSSCLELSGEVSKGDHRETLMVEGQAVFLSYGCPVCHSLKGEGGNKGPPLDELSRKMDGTTIRESILEPDRKVKAGYKPGIMPSDFSSRINDKELDALIFYLTNI